MTTTEKKLITIQATVDAPIKKVWDRWTRTQHIIRWNNASDDWHTTYATNDLRVGGKFVARMEAKDGSMGFDFGGTYTLVEEHQRIEYRMGGERMVNIAFKTEGDQVIVTEQFEAEGTNSDELQRSGWQAILNNFKRYTESDKMDLLEFSCTIKAPVHKVYTTMLEDATYREWTSVFNDSSHYIGTWDKGAKILFIGTDEKGNKGGMVSRVKENIPDQYLSIEHLGLLEGDNEITTGEKVEGWAGALENYTYRQDGGSTVLQIDMDANQQFKDYFSETWPKALDKLKAICEG